MTTTKINWTTSNDVDYTGKAADGRTLELHRCLDREDRFVGRYARSVVFTAGFTATIAGTEFGLDAGDLRTAKKEAAAMLADATAEAGK